MAKTSVRTLQQILTPSEISLPPDWQARVIQSDDCMSYVLWNQTSREAVLIDPKEEDREAYEALVRELSGYLWVAVIDTHTHADHLSIAAAMAEEIGAPLVMHATSLSARVHLRVGKDSFLPTHAGPIHFIHTPGHTPDSLTVIWGPFVLGGDTVLYGDCGRDDLPGGDAEAHYESLQILKKRVPAQAILLPGHDHRGGRASSWAIQLAQNPALIQSRDEFIPEAKAFDAPAPALLKKALRENFR